MTQQRKLQISHLNDASDKIVKSYDDLEAEAENLPDVDKKYKVIKCNVDSILEACANPREVYTEQSEERGKND